MKTVRKEWPRVRQYVKAGNTYFSVDLRRKHYQGQKWKNYTSRDKALEFASDLAKKVAKSGLDSIKAVQEGDRVKAWAEQCAVYGKTVEQAIEAALEVWEKERKVKESPFMSGLLSSWMLDKIENPHSSFAENRLINFPNMSGNYIRNREGKIIGRWDGNWLRDGTGKLVARYDKSDNRTRTHDGKIVGDGDQRLRKLSEAERPR